MSENDRKGVGWGRWIGWGLAILVFLLLLSHAIWSSIAAKRLQALVEKAIAAGEPVYPSDFAYSSVNAPDNAALDIVAAATLLKTDSPEWKKYNALREALGVPLRANEEDALAEVAPALVPTFERLEAARGKTRIAWNFDVTSPVASQLPPPLMNEIRALANALQIQALLDFDQGHHRAAIDRIEQIFFISQFPDHHPSLIGHLVAIGCGALGSNTLIDMAADLKIGLGPDDISPEQARRLIDQILDEQSASDGLLRCLRGERMMQLDSMECLLKGIPIGAGAGSPGTAWHPVARYLAAPVLRQNASAMFRHMTVTLEAVPEKTWPDFRSKLPHIQTTGSVLNRFAEILLPSLDRASETHFRVLADRRLAAVALAVRWYSAEHNGALPAKLKDLVPQYLPAVPMDPLAAGARPLQYNPSPTAPIVYSVGVDGTDDGGSEASSDPKPKVLHEWMMKDRVQPLYRRPRPEPESDPAP